MPHGLGGPELIIILVLVMLVFGVGRLGSIGSSLGKGIREFKAGVSGRSEDEPKRLGP
ncbi:MAG: twin-arginine translocase TatA/TatE family subunit [Chloroflexota bacterium]|nr:twin-arginine translocase TatA/TatE family subunit [Chloroflexota bacterium]